MTTKTVSAKVTTATEPSYTELLRRVRALTTRDAETRFELAVIFSKMLKHKSAEDVSEDTDVPPGGIKRMAAVADFWGNVRIKADGAGKRPAPWALYDRIANDPVIPSERRVLIKRAAPRGLSIVRQMVQEARQVTIAQVNEVVNGKRASKATTTRPPVASARGTVSSDRPSPPMHDAVTYLTAVLHSFDAGNEYLDKLESLSASDAARVRARINTAAAHLVRLSRVEP